MSILKIAYSCDNNYIQQTGISLISLLDNNQSAIKIDIYLISKNISEENIEILRSIVARYNRKLIIIPFDSICYDLNISDIGRHIETIYSKIFFSRISDLDKIIYLDSDTIIVRSLEELWNQDIDDVYMGVVQTGISKKNRRLLNIPIDHPVFNDGMAFVNVNYCRDNNLIEKVKDELIHYNGMPPVLSEGLLNKICLDHVKYISPRYNLMAGLLHYCTIDVKYMAEELVYSENELIESCNNPVVIHFLTSSYNRPWCESCTNPFRDQFYKYKNMSPWKDERLIDSKLPFKTRFYEHIIKIIGLRNFENLRKYLGRI